MPSQQISLLAVSWHLVMPEFFLCVGHAGMTILGWEGLQLCSQNQATVRCHFISHIPLFVCYSGHLSACGRPAIVYEPVDSGGHWVALSLLTWANLMPLKAMWSTHISKWISSVCLMESLHRASGSCTSVPGLCLIVASSCCRLKSILYRWGDVAVKMLRVIISWRLWSVTNVKEQPQRYVLKYLYAQMTAKNSQSIYAYWVSTFIRDFMKRL